jgi:TrmH family RNA methyltransferase
VENIEHISRAKLKAVAALSVKKFRRSEGAFLIEGETLLREALNAGWEVLEVVASEDWLDKSDLLATLRQRKIKIDIGGDADLRRLSDTANIQPVISVVADRPISLNGLPPDARRIVALVGVQDPGNVGAIIRSADAFGLAAVVLTEGCAEWQNPKVLRAAMGSCFHLPLVSDVPVDDLLAWLREKEIAPIAAVAHGGDNVSQFSPPRAWALLLGNEAAGLPEDIVAECKHRVTLLTPGRAESLNVAVGAGVMMHVLTQSREGAS